MTPANDDAAPTDSPPASTDAPGGPDSTDASGPDVPDVPAAIDWLLGGLVALAGLVFALGGVAVYVVPDREAVEAAVAADDVQLEGLTEAEFVEVMLALVTWAGIGLVVTGLAMLALGIAYVVHRRRVHRRAAAGEPTSDFYAHALVGAAVSAVTSFVPLSPILGGGVAGYLERGDSERTISVGTVSAVLMTLPFLVVGLFVAVGLGVGFAGIADGGMGVLMAVMVVVGGLISLGFTALLGAGGGWIGGWLADRGADT